MGAIPAENPNVDSGALASELHRSATAVVDTGVRFERGTERPLGAKGRRTRAVILRGARRAFTELGWTGTTVGEVAARAGVGAGTIYQYFRSKTELLAALVGESTLAALDQIRAWDPAAGPDGLRELIGAFVQGYARTAPMQAVWEEVSLVEPELAALRRDLTEVYVGLFADALAAGGELGILDPGPDPRETARALCAMVDRYCNQAFVHDFVSTDADAASELLTRLWTAAIRMA